VSIRQHYNKVIVLQSVGNEPFGGRRPSECGIDAPASKSFDKFTAKTLLKRQ
jgi:hypothetical protein